MTNDPFALLAMDETDWPPDVDPVALAVRRFDPADPSPLVKLLESGDPMMSWRGLRVFGDLGRTGIVVLDTALKLTGHPADTARHALMDGVMCYCEALNANQARAVLNLINDPFRLVRAKVMIFLAYADLASLEAAIASLEEPRRTEHRAGFETLIREPLDVQKLFDEAAARDDTWAPYAFASINRLARKVLLQPVPEYAGDACLPEGMIFHVKMLNARRRRR